jgi:hypothetical protein
MQGNCSPQGQQQSLIFTAPAQVAVLRQDNQRTQTPAGWNRTDFADLSDGSRQMLLRSTAPANLPPEIRMIAVY